MHSLYSFFFNNRLLRLKREVEWQIFFVAVCKVSKLSTSTETKKPSLAFFCKLSCSRDEKRQEKKNENSSTSRSFVFCLFAYSFFIHFRSLVSLLEFNFSFIFLYTSSDPWKAASCTFFVHFFFHH